MTAPLSDDDMLYLGQQYFRMADREGATDKDQTTLRDFVPALLHRFREKVVISRDPSEIPVLDLRFCGVELADGEEQIELALPLPE